MFLVVVRHTFWGTLLCSGSRDVCLRTSAQHVSNLDFTGKGLFGVVTGSYPDWKDRTRGTPEGPIRDPIFSLDPQ